MTYRENLTQSANDPRLDPTRGSAYRYVRDAYAYSVTLAMTGGRDVCPCCEAPITPATVECDRAVPALGYAPGNIVAVCAGKTGCNQQRARLQTTGDDWTNVDAYVADVRQASENVAIPTITAARDWWKASRVLETRASRYA